ncbi:hypothetical protein CHS0354_038920 [Potamilus streckersoni]|uniref:Protein kinase domain-containing protein n=1 Tax=Potamilus streckersoni TaxID=2493646 RepID=A0AAE0S163_9BIVA|nr:hypothetical protein CHS0354_038920 [Potamilus streckersoni]
MTLIEVGRNEKKTFRMNLLLQKYRILGKKGEGTFSEVLKCQNVKDGTYCACKKMKQTYDSLEQVNNLREIQAMRRLSPHANVIELQEIIFDKKSGCLMLILELMDMNIYELIRGLTHYLPEFTVRKYMYQLCKSVDYMHRNGIFHRDVKPENILIKEEVLKLADFGSCRSVYSKQPYTEYISTRWYRAPECLLTDGFYTYKMDMWSVGCVFFEILSLHPLFPGSNEVDQITKIHDVMGTPDPSVLNKFKKSRGMNFNFPTKKGTGIERLLPNASPDSIELIYKMCTYDPDERMTARQALKHPYFKELREAEKRTAALNKSKVEETSPRKVNIVEPTTPEVETMQKEKKSIKDSESDVHLIASLPKPQSLPVHHLYKSKKRRHKRMVESQHQYSSQAGLFPKVPVHNSSINPSYHSKSFQTSFSKIHDSSDMSLLPGIASTYKTHKSTNKTSKNIFGQYQLPSLDRRGAGF